MKAMMLTKHKLGDLLEVTRGASLSGEYFATQGDYMRLTCGNFDYQNNCFKSNTSKDNLYYIGNFNQEYLMEKDDIITPLTEQAVGLLGSTAWVPESGKYIQSQDVAKITPNEKLLDKKFCYYLISSKVVKQQLSAAAQQTKIRHTSPDKIKDCTVWIPSLEEQAQIGQFLYDIDSKIALNRQINDNLEAMARQLYEYWFVQFDFPDENGKPYKSNGGKMVWNECMKKSIPADWKTSLLSEWIDYSLERVSTSVVSDGDFYTPIEVIPRNKMSLSTTLPVENAVSGLCRYKKKDILLSNRRVYFHKICLAPFDGLTRDTVMVLRTKHEVNLGYIYETMFSDSFISYATKVSYGSLQPVLSWTEAQKYHVLTPAKNLSEKYGKLINGIIEKVLSSQMEIIQLTKQRDELLPLLMNGQATVNYHLSDD